MFGALEAVNESFHSIVAQEWTHGGHMGKFRQNMFANVYARSKNRQSILSLLLDAQIRLSATFAHPG
jgi:hypothetical protein